MWHMDTFRVDDVSLTTIKMTHRICVFTYRLALLRGGRRPFVLAFSYENSNLGYAHFWLELRGVNPPC